MSEKKKSLQYLSGTHAVIPVVFGFVPVGIAYAIMAWQTGFSVLQTCGMSLAVLAGASQMIAVGMYIQGASIIAMILAALILNLRHLIMSVRVVNRTRKDTTKIKLLAAFGVTDESFAIFTTEKVEKCSAWFLPGLIIVTYASWNVGTLIGAVASDFLPEIVTASLSIALYAMLIGVLIPNLTKNWRLGILVALAAACSSILTQFIKPSWVLIASTLICTFIGVFFVDLEPGGKEESIDGQR